MKKANFWKEAFEANHGTFSNPGQKNKLIIVLGNPRSYTTVPVRVWEARKDGTAIINEPGVYAYNVQISPPQQKPELTEHLFVGGIPTFKGVTEKITQELNQRNVFVKDTLFAAKHYLNSEFPNIDSDNTYFFFMLREPADSMVSNYKILQMGIDANLADAWSYKDMLDLYANLSKCNKNTYLIDSQDLLNDPEACIQLMCERAEVPFIPESLTWAPLLGSNQLGPDCRFVAQWQDTIAASSGIDKNLGSKAKRNADGSPTFEEISPAHRDSYIKYYQEHLPYYQKLVDHFQEQLQFSLKSFQF